jgi:hypothetical protein
MRRTGIISWLAIIVALIAVGTAEAAEYRAERLSERATSFVQPGTFCSAEGECNAPIWYTVWCAPLRGGLLGYTFVPGTEVWIARQYCNPLLALAGGLEIKPKLQGGGLLILAHELWHQIDIEAGEAETECHALQQVDDLARIFNAREGYIPVLWDRAYKLHTAITTGVPEYRNLRKCRPNGEWDLTPGDRSWP